MLRKIRIICWGLSIGILIMTPVRLICQQDSTIVIGSPGMISSSKRALLRGSITNPTSGEVIFGATVFVKSLGIGTVSNEEGSYALLLPVGTYEIAYSSIGLDEQVKKVMIYTDGVLDIGLLERAFSLEEVVVRHKAGDHNVADVKVGAVELSIKEIGNIPSFMGETDVLNSLQTLPGVSSIGEGARGINVRGGKIDQNLVLFGGAPLLNTSHALGLFSVFNPDVVEKFILYKGSVPAQFGGRVSSVLDVATRKGDFGQWNFKGGIGPVMSKFMAEGPIVKNKTSLLAAGRATYSNWLLKSLERPEIRESRANFSDWNGILSHKVNAQNTLTFSFYKSWDYFRYAGEFGYEWDTQLTGLHWQSILNSKFSSSTRFNAGLYKSLLFEPEGTRAFNFRTGLKYKQLNQDFFWNPNPTHIVHFGMEATEYQSLPDQIGPRGESSGIAKQQVQRDKGRQIGWYGNDEITLNSRLAVSVGLRISAYQHLGADSVFLYESGKAILEENLMDTLIYRKGSVIKSFVGLEPRVSIRYRTGSTSSVKLSYNRNRQYLHLISNTTASTPVDIWQGSTSYIPPQVSDNYSLGYFRNFGNNAVETSIEVFYRSTDKVVDYKNFARFLLNNHLETEVLSGLGKAYGLEVFVKKNEGRWTGWLSYTFTRSLLKIAGQIPATTVNRGNWYPSNYDKPHDVTITSSYQLSKSTFWGLNFTYNTGRPITAIISSYEINGVVVPHYSERNAYRIKDYYRLDMSLTIYGKWLVDRKYRGNFTLSVFNLLSRKNAFSVYYKKVDNIQVPQAVQLSILGSFLPAVSYNFSF